MSVLSSVYYEELPNRDRWGTIQNDDTVAVHVAVSGWDVVHLALEVGHSEHFDAVEVNLSIEDALELHAKMAKAIGEAMRGRTSYEKQKKAKGITR